MTRWNRRPAAVAAALALALYCAGGAEDSLPRYEVSRPCMGTEFRITVYSDNTPTEIDTAIEAAFSVARELDAILSDYRADSEVGRFHRSPIATPWNLSPAAAVVLEKACVLSLATGGAFDPARGAQTRLWRMARRTERLPTPAETEAARAASGIAQLEWDSDRGTLARESPLTRLDFGGIAKGYAADQMLSVLRGHGIPIASIAAGGDLRVGDAPPGRKGWRVTVRPRGDSDEGALTIELRNAAVSTSGNTEQHIEIEGALYSHIIDPATGLGMTSARAASVIAPTATESDALATALCIVGKPGLASFVTPRKGCAGVVFNAPDGSEEPASAAFTAHFESFLIEE